MDYAIQKATELGVTAIQLLTSQHGEVHLKAAQIPKKLMHWQQVALSECEQCGLNRPPLILAPVSIKDWLTNNTLQQTSKRQPSAIDSHQVSDMIAPLLADSYYQAINALPQLRLLLAVPKALSTLSATVEGFNSSDQDRQLNEQPSINLCHPQNQPLLWQHIQKVCQTSAAYIQLMIGPEGGFSQEEHELAVATGFLPWQLGERVLRAETAPVVALATLHGLSMRSC